MCGIVGEWNIQGARAETLQRMADEIRHRGPDDEGFYVDGQIGLGSRRLSIIDLSTGRQPISNEDGSVWIVLNGEIYNYPALRKLLAERGHHFSTHTDTEVIVHLYEEYGPDAVKKLRGMFAFALWDTKQRRLLIARDPLGQKPLYYLHRPGRFVFASEIKAILTAGDVVPRLNAEAMHNFISLRCIPGPETLFEGIEKLPAGSYLTLQDGRLDITEYWSLQYNPKLKDSPEQITEQLRQKLLETVVCHMLSDVPLGAFLSGGLDSTLIASMMATLSDRPISTFSIGVREQDFNELPFARMVADRYRTDHHEYIVDPNVVGALPRMIWHMEEPVDPFAFGVYSVARLAAEHVKVVLGGDGGDEIFAGYDRYLGNQLVDMYCLLPKPIRQRVVEPLIDRLPDNFSYNNRVQKLRWMAAMSDSTAGERYAQSASFLRFGQAHKQALYTDALWRKLGGYDSTIELVKFFDADNATHPVDKMLYTDVKTRLADHLLMIGDRMTMAHSLEGRSPYVDQEVVAFVASIPAELKLNGRTLKYIQRRIARDYLPEPLLKRRKQGFGFPLAYWFRSDLREPAARIFRQSQLAAEGYFRPQALLDLLDEHASGRIDHNYRLWLLFNLELWYRQFIGKQSIEEVEELVNRSMQPAARGATSGASNGHAEPAGAGIREVKVR
jgi:asparagine synthase (glutamine-hydrolysing)